MRHSARLFLVGLLVSTLFFSPSFAGSAISPEHPDQAQTPGDVCDKSDPDFHEYRYDEKIPYCARNVSTSVKAAIYEAYGISQKQRRNYTIDHFIPLSIGGSNETENLWPEHKLIKQQRPDLEHDVYLSLKNGELSQAEAIEIIVQAKMNQQ